MVISLEAGKGSSYNSKRRCVVKVGFLIKGKWVKSSQGISETGYDQRFFGVEIVNFKFIDIIVQLLSMGTFINDNVSNLDSDAKIAWVGFVEPFLKQYTENHQQIAFNVVQIVPLDSSLSLAPV